MFRILEIKSEYIPFRSSQSNLKDSETIDEETLKHIPSLFQIPDFDCYEYHQVRKIMFSSIEYCKTSILDEKLMKCLKQKNKLVSFTSLSVLLYYLFKKKYKDPAIFKDELTSYFDSDDVDFKSEIINSEEKEIFKSLKEFLNDEDIIYKLLAHKICRYLNIDKSLSVSKMIDFTLSYIEYKKIQQNLVLVWGQTGHGKTTLINYLTGTQYKSVICETFLIPIKGSFEKFKTTDSETSNESETTYCEIEKLTDEKTVVDLPDFKETSSGNIKKSLIAELMLPLLIQKIENLKAYSNGFYCV